MNIHFSCKSTHKFWIINQTITNLIIHHWCWKCKVLFLGVMTLRITTLSIMTLSIMTFSILTLSIEAYFVTLSTNDNDTQHNNNLPLCWASICTVKHFICFYAECHYAECCSAEFCYAECYYAKCYYAECYYAEFHYAECRDTAFWHRWLKIATSVVTAKNMAMLSHTSILNGYLKCLCPQIIFQKALYIDTFLLKIVELSDCNYKVLMLNY
jgi:hypothetical protein